MPRKNQHIPKDGAIWKLSSAEATLGAKPRYNGFACGYGVHGDVKFNRAKEKARFARAMKNGE